MKKLGVLFLSALILSACQSEEGKEPVTESEANQEVAADQVDSVEAEAEPTTLFENGTLETDKFNLTISKTEVIQSPMEEKPGLYVTFNLTNKTDNEDVVPIETLAHLRAQQENETSRIDLVENYHFLDAFGDDTETYNKMVDLDNASSNALLPGKSVDFVAAYSLDNDTNEVTFIGIDTTTFAEVGTHKIKLK